MKLSEFGKVVRRLRLERDLTLGDLSPAVDCSIAYLSAVERGTKTPSPKLVRGLIDLFGLSNRDARDLELAALKTRKRIVVEHARSADANLFTIFAHQVSHMDGNETQLLERAISDESTFKLVIEFAKKVLAEQDRRQSAQLSFDIVFDAPNPVSVLLKRSFAAHAGRSVPPMGKAKIATACECVRQRSGNGVTDVFDVVRFLDDGLEGVTNGYGYEVLADEVFVAQLIGRKWDWNGLNCVQAFTDPFNKEIVFRQSVFAAACRRHKAPEVAKARFTVAHEIGHALLHDELYDAGVHHRGTQPLYADSEWQADVAARHILLSPKAVLQYNNAEEMAAEQVVTHQCAQQHWGHYARGVTDRRQGILI